jgi:large subunit ribosomal protein L4|tara:strand:- start:1165 stop:1788 length:624 start_codon:yes stop_codon:yes gene_type:complete
MKKTILNLKNKSVGDIDLDNTIFGIKKLPDIIHQYIRYQNAKSRQGSHKTKSRSEVSGRSKKPFSQKGTGNARQGSNKPPNFRGGAVSMGPVNRDHSFSLNKKEKKLAIKSALSVKATQDKIVIIDTFEIKSFKTKDLFSDLKNFDYKSALFIYSEKDLNNNFKLASSNIPKISTLNQKGINVKDLITFDKIFIDQKSINEITERLS